MPPSSAGSGRRIACWTLSLIVMSAPSRRLRTVAANTARAPATATVPKRYPSSVVRVVPVTTATTAYRASAQPATSAVIRPLHRAQASSGPTASRPVRLKLPPIRIPVTAMTASSTRAITIQTGCCPMALVARRSSRRMRPHPSYPCDEI